MPGYKKWSRHSPRSHRAPSLAEQQERNREAEWAKQAAEYDRKAATGKTGIAEARAQGLPILVQKSPHNERAWLVQVGPNGKLWVAMPGFDKAAKEMHPADLDRVEDWTMENPTPELQHAWTNLLSDKRTWDAMRHEQWLQQQAEEARKAQREADRFRAAD